MQMRPEVELLLYSARMQMGIGHAASLHRLLQAPGLS